MKNHGPNDPVLRLLLLLLADFRVQDDGSRWATITVLAGQSGLPERSVRERLQQVDGVWFRRWIEGRRYYYTLLDPGPGAVIPTVSDLREHRNDRAGIEGADSGTTAHQHRNDRAEKPVNTGTTAPPRRSETSIDYEHDGRSGPQGAPDRRLSPNCEICPDCGAEFVNGGECGLCLHSTPRTAPPTFAPLSPDLNDAVDRAIGGGR